MQTDREEEQLGLFDQDSWCGRMYQEPLVPTREKTSKPSSQKSYGSRMKKPPMCLCLKTADGEAADASTMKWADGALLGEYTMHSFGESPKEENASRLSQILEDCPPPKYSLSARACVGILNRANKRGKALPPELKEALERQAHEADNQLYPED